MTRKLMAGALTTLCLFGLTAPVAAASGSGKQKGRVDPTSIVTGLDAPKYGAASQVTIRSSTRS